MQFQLLDFQSTVGLADDDELEDEEEIANQSFSGHSNLIKFPDPNSKHSSLKCGHPAMGHSYFKFSLPSSARSHVRFNRPGSGSAKDGSSDSRIKVESVHGGAGIRWKWRHDGRPAGYPVLKTTQPTAGTVYWKWDQPGVARARAGLAPWTAGSTKHGTPSTTDSATPGRPLLTACTAPSGSTASIADWVTLVLMTYTAVTAILVRHPTCVQGPLRWPYQWWTRHTTTGDQIITILNILFSYTNPIAISCCNRQLAVSSKS